MLASYVLCKHQKMTESQSPQTPETNHEVSLKLCQGQGRGCKVFSEESLLPSSDCGRRRKLEGLDLPMSSTAFPSHFPSGYACLRFFLSSYCCSFTFVYGFYSCLFPPLKWTKIACTSSGFTIEPPPPPAPYGAWCIVGIQ